MSRFLLLLALAGCAVSQPRTFDDQTREFPSAQPSSNYISCGCEDAPIVEGPIHIDHETITFHRVTMPNGDTFDVAEIHHDKPRSEPAKKDSKR